MYVDKECLDAGYDALANAIILQACKDYRRALRGYKKNEIIKIRKFFHSQWYSELTNISGDCILKEIERQVKYERAGHEHNAIKKCNQTENRKNK